MDDISIFQNIAKIIENRKSRAMFYTNSEVTLMFWEIGRYINTVLLDSKRAGYGKQIVSTLSANFSFCSGHVSCPKMKNCFSNR